MCVRGNSGSRLLTARCNPRGAQIAADAALLFSRAPKRLRRSDPGPRCTRVMIDAHAGGFLDMKPLAGQGVAVRLPPTQLVVVADGLLSAERPQHSNRA